eukprot:4999728-Prymnesium_polylepis.2
MRRGSASGVQQDVVRAAAIDDHRRTARRDVKGKWQPRQLADVTAHARPDCARPTPSGGGSRGQHCARQAARAASGQRGRAHRSSWTGISGPCA